MAHARAGIERTDIAKGGAGIARGGREDSAGARASRRGDTLGRGRPAARNGQPRRPGRRPAASRAATRRILIVEDDADIAESARQAIERFVPGCEALVATHAAQGLAILQAQAVDALLVDYRLPGKDGLAFIQQAHALEPGLPVILMTADRSADLAARAVNRHHIEGYLPKPFDVVVLAETVAGVLRRHAAAV